MVVQEMRRIGRVPDTSFIATAPTKSLPLHPEPFHDESRTGWELRLAYLNCLDVRFQRDNRDNHLNDPMISAIGSLDKDFTTAFTERFCPKCFSESRTPYYKKEWDHRWINHCLIHGIPLISKCKKCSPDNFVDSQPYWCIPWIACENCCNLGKEKNDEYVANIAPSIRAIINALEDCKLCSDNTLFSLGSRRLVYKPFARVLDGILCQ